MASTGSSLVGSVKDLVGLAESNGDKRKIGKDMDKDAFLRLLITQLKNQDPMKPMADTEFIAQMAQFSSLEQMTNMNKLLEGQSQFAALSQASGMIGKTVTVVAPGEGGGTYTGPVSEVRQAGGKIEVVVNGEAYDSTWINKIASSGSASTDPASAPPASGPPASLPPGSQFIPVPGQQAAATTP